MTFDDEKRDAAISALYRYFMGPGANQVAVSEVRIKHVFSDAIGAPFAAAMFGELVKFELLRRSDAVELYVEEGSAYEATAEFFRMAQLIENSTPASDRFVSLDDNRETADNVAELAAQLSAKTPESNTLSEVLPEKEDRKALAQEIKNLGETVRLPKALKAPLEALLNVLKRVFEKVADGSFKALGFQLLKGLAKLLGLDWFE